MKVTYSFLNSEDKPSLIPLIQLNLIKEIVNKDIVVSEELLNRCVEIRDNLIKFPEDIIKVESLKELREDPWWYEELKGTNYKGMSSVRLSKGTDSTKGDRLIFTECPMRYSDQFVIIEELFHYLRDLKVSNLQGLDLDLYRLLDKAYNAHNAIEIADKLSNLSIKKSESKIWFFD